MRPTGVDRTSRRGTKATVHLIRPHRTQTVPRIGSDCLSSEGRTRPWASMEQEPAYVGNHIANPRFGPAAAVGAAPKPVALGKDDPGRSSSGGRTGPVVAQSGVDVPERHLFLFDMVMLDATERTQRPVRFCHG